MTLEIGLGYKFNSVNRPSARSDRSSLEAGDNGSELRPFSTCAASVRLIAKEYVFRLQEGGMNKHYANLSCRFGGKYESLSRLRDELCDGR